MNKRGISLLLEDEEVQNKPPQNVPLWHGGPAGFKETYSLPWLPILDSNTLATWCEEPTHWKRSWHWERLKAKGGGAGKGWDGWMRHQLNRHEFEQTLGDSEGQGSVVCCSPWGHKVRHNFRDWTTTRGYPGYLTPEWFAQDLTFTRGWSLGYIFCYWLSAWWGDCRSGWWIIRYCPWLGDLSPFVFLLAPVYLPG